MSYDDLPVVEIRADAFPTEWFIRLNSPGHGGLLHYLLDFAQANMPLPILDPTEAERRVVNLCHVEMRRLVDNRILLRDPDGQWVLKRLTRTAVDDEIHIRSSSGGTGTVCGNRIGVDADDDEKATKATCRSCITLFSRGEEKT